ncbi:hypothetical protein AAMO2058_000730900 [Amorphochlora amoebiformis]
MAETHGRFSGWRCASWGVSVAVIVLAGRKHGKSLGGVPKDAFAHLERRHVDENEFDIRKSEHFRQISMDSWRSPRKSLVQIQRELAWERGRRQWARGKDRLFPRIYGYHNMFNLTDNLTNDSSSLRVGNILYIRRRERINDSLLQFWDEMSDPGVLIGSITAPDLFPKAALFANITRVFKKEDKCTGVEVEIRLRPKNAVKGYIPRLPKLENRLLNLSDIPQERLKSLSMDTYLKSILTSEHLRAKIKWILTQDEPVYALESIRLTDFEFFNFTQHLLRLTRPGITSYEIDTARRYEQMTDTQRVQHHVLPPTNINQETLLYEAEERVRFQEMMEEALGLNSTEFKAMSYNQTVRELELVKDKIEEIDLHEEILGGHTRDNLNRKRLKKRNDRFWLPSSSSKNMRDESGKRLPALSIPPKGNKSDEANEAMFNAKFSYLTGDLLVKNSIMPKPRSLSDLPSHLFQNECTESENSRIRHDDEDTDDSPMDINLGLPPAVSVPAGYVIDKKPNFQPWPAPQNLKQPRTLR